MRMKKDDGPWKNVGASKACDRDPKKREKKMLFLGFLLLLLAAYGTATLCSKTYDHFFGKKKIPVMLSTTLGKPGQPHVLPNSYDFSDMDATLEGIERQLERMNNIQLKIHQEGR